MPVFDGFDRQHLSDLIDVLTRRYLVQAYNVALTLINLANTVILKWFIVERGLQMMFVP
jgi:hypothetical protein